MTYDPQTIMGPATGNITNESGKVVGYFWESEASKMIQDEHVLDYWDYMHTNGLENKEWKRSYG